MLAICAPLREFRANVTADHADSVKRCRSAIHSVTSTVEISRAWGWGKSVKQIRNRTVGNSERVATRGFTVYSLSNDAAELDTTYPEIAEAVRLSRGRWRENSEAVFSRGKSLMSDFASLGRSRTTGLRHISWHGLSAMRSAIRVGTEVQPYGARRTLATAR